MTPQQIKDLQTNLNLKGAGLKVDGILGPKTTEAMNKAIAASLAGNPMLSGLTAQNSPEAIVNAYNTGNWGGVLDVTGAPFSEEEQRLAVEKANAALAPGFEAQQRYDEQNLARSLEDKTRAFGEYVDKSATDFEADKEALDLDAANKGVLFSGSRIQKEKNLKNLYETDQASKRANVGSDISKLTGDYQYKYGDESVQKPTLSQYYQLGGNTYNPKVARGGVTPSGLSTIYSGAGKNFQGTEVNKNKAAVQTRAASLLANKANKIVPYGYQNQF